jgi:unsaturated chondroitin disaccharide hydrolase
LSEHATRPEAVERFSTAAREYTDRYLAEGDVSWMFAGMSFFHGGFQSYDFTGNRIPYGLGFMGADAMTDLFDERARQIPIGDIDIEGPEEEFGFGEDSDVSGRTVAAVDNIYVTLPILWRAYEETGDPEFRDIAISHADRHLDWFVRGDGRTWNGVRFDPDTGKIDYHFNVLAHSDDTCWARGQAWNIAGLAHAYAHTRASRYYTAMERSIEYYLDHSPDDLVPYWDFEAPTIPDAVRDTSAAAITACGLLQLPHEERTTEYRNLGERILDSLVENYLVTDDGDDRYGMVLHGCYDRPSEYAVDNELVWTDYYVAKALWTLRSS